MITNYRKAQYLFGIDDAIMIPAAVSAGASLLGGALGFGSQSSANNTNRLIARETNAANLELAKMQNDWNLDMWNKTNEYNSPANLLKLLREAGLNPNFFMGSVAGNAGASALLSADLATQLIGAQMLAYDPSGALTAAGDSLFRAKEIQIAQKRADAEARNLDANSAETEKRTAFLYDGEDSMSEIQKKEAKLRVAEYDWKFKTYKELLKASKLARKIAAAKWEDEHFQNQLTQKLMLADLDLKPLQAKEIVSRICANYASAARDNALASVSELDAAIKAIVKEITANDKTISDEKVKQAKADAKVAEAKAAVEGSQAYQVTSAIIDLVGDAIGEVQDAISIRSMIKGDKRADRRDARDTAESDLRVRESGLRIRESENRINNPRTSTRNPSH